VEKLSNHIIDYMPRHFDLNGVHRGKLEDVRDEMLAVRQDAQADQDALAWREG
jgi:hypothetical protein